MSLLIIGDVHAQYKEYLELLGHYKDVPSVQVGDLGLGFVPVPPRPENSYFIRGNHDNPDLCRIDTHYLGDYGIEEINGIRFFYLSGAWSIDQKIRVEGRDWWKDEELSTEDLNAAVALYLKEKPDIVITHDGPNVVTTKILNRFSLFDTTPTPSRTGDALNDMYNGHQPLLWVFGHWHTRWRETIGRTEFRCLAPVGPGGWTLIEK